MDYSISDATIVHPSGRRMHQGHLPVPSAVEPNDLNSLLWSLNHLRETAGVGAAIFNANDPNTYNRVTASVQALAAGVGNVSMASFTGGNHSLTANGFQKLPGGLILQWVTGSEFAVETSQTVSWPIQFPNACLFALVGTTCSTSAAQGDGVCQLVSKNASNVVVLHQFVDPNQMEPIGPSILGIGF